jgi:hypothetical protein
VVLAFLKGACCILLAPAFFAILLVVGNSDLLCFALPLLVFIEVAHLFYYYLAERLTTEPAWPFGKTVYDVTHRGELKPLLNSQLRIVNLTTF